MEMLARAERVTNFDAIHAQPISAEIIPLQPPCPFRNGAYAVVIRSGHEQDATDHFREEGVTCYWPNYERLIPLGRGRRRQMYQSLIPGFVFSPVANTDAFWWALQKIPFVINVLRKEDGWPAVISHGDIETIRNIEARESVQVEAANPHAFKVGDKVRFGVDIHCGWGTGKVIRLAHSERITIECHAMGRNILLHVLPSQIERCK
jgi:transcription antitermination factor NusG